MSAPILERVPEAPAATVLSAAGLSVSGPRGVIVEPLDLKLSAGQTLVVVGESGSGKTLTARALTGLLPTGITASGALELNGRGLAPGSKELAAARGGGITLLLQDPFTSLSPTHRVGRQIGWALGGSAAARSARVAALLAEVGLDASVASKRPFELSGGMRQRVALAAALAADPSVLIADEPTTALDVTTQREVLDLIDELQAKRGMALLLITHDLAVARDRADEALVMRHGKVLERGPASRVLFDPEHEYTRSLLAADLGVEAAEALAEGESLPDGAGQDVDRAGDSATTPASVVPGAGRRGTDGDGATQPSDVVRSGAGGALLRVTGLRKSFPGQARPALAGVDLELADGQTLAVVGESGSGKTTLARCLVGLERPDAGSIEFLGRATGPRRAQIVFQDPYSALNPARSIGAGLEEAAAVGGGVRTPGELLELVGLPADYAPRRPAALSGGERQRVAIARALAVEPELLILDESVSALDVSVQAQILALLARLQERLGLSMLFITHDLSVARAVSSSVVVLRHGEVVERGSTASVLFDPQHEYTQALLASIPGRGAAHEQQSGARDAR
ncbi:ABC transporter ATP-binding protein [Galactobacter valiniphilus]|uniref:ABC transporter ATP-binding protein n=1 Tax=Galactobacter valiniphilus TaxID=2676122 RepID=A0A399JB76_9MICC|nr:ABC transporter ATP-binding protein [Galactobacter valiniphilus]RII41479.1 ABC transporter ATP-binding protein [Galactobacter valiniphilus]